jgi:hypothetical protein
MLQRVNRRSLQPSRLCIAAPGCQLLGHRDIADELAACRVVLLLQRQRLVKHEPARTREAAHLALLLAIGHEFVLEGLETLHGRNSTLALWVAKTILGAGGTAFS